MVFEFFLLEESIHCLLLACFPSPSRPQAVCLQLDALPVWGQSGEDVRVLGLRPFLFLAEPATFHLPAFLSPVGAFPPSPLCFSSSCLLLASSSLGLCLSSFLFRPPCLCTCNLQCERPQCTRTHPYSGVTGEGQTLQD